MDAAAVTVRLAVPADVGPLADVMARAFYDDPPFACMLPEPRTRQVRSRRLFATILRAGALERGGVEVAVEGGAIVGGAIWLRPGTGNRPRSGNCGPCRSHGSMPTSLRSRMSRGGRDPGRRLVDATVWLPYSRN
ncbi:MAG: hypothetical protein ACLQDY_10775 [Streptosporangiaceae bacterium]